MFYHPPASGANCVSDSDKPVLLPLGLGPCHLGVPIWLRSCRGRVCFCGLRTEAHLLDGGVSSASREVTWVVATLNTTAEKMSQLSPFRGSSFSLTGFVMGPKGNTCQLLNHLYLILHSKAFPQHTCPLSWGRRDQESGPLSAGITGPAPAATPTH